MTQPVKDPGGARAKGYGADETPGTPPPPEGPIPVATEPTGHVITSDPDLTPTGRDEAEGGERGRILGEGP